MKKLFIVTLAALGMLACTSQNDPIVTNGLLPEMFSVSASRQVQFSRGNLLYHPLTEIFLIAPHQYDVVGAGNTNISGTYGGVIDLFGWGTGNNPINTSKNDLDYSSFTDWGKNDIAYNDTIDTIYKGGWRTLSKDEWTYLFTGRTNAAELFGFGQLNGVNGIILLPDNWVKPKGVNFTAGSAMGLNDIGNYVFLNTNNNFSYNNYTIEQWAKMDSAGVVFLPAAGNRTRGNIVEHVGTAGCYWSSTSDGSGNAYYLSFGQHEFHPQGTNLRSHGFSVRLVR